ncbi:TPA: DEAD/DEAH box helicase family protein [Candidatus Micrarchaeota archaeon]|nr:DEAD/DEAH box helicase family protein [Candidatus Micrarchaeota archaeon]
MPLTQTPRAYQIAIYDSIMQNGNTLVVLPTGLGKTLIALMLIQRKLGEGKGKCLFLSPTKPLGKQHYSSVMKTLGLEEDSVSLVSGEISPKKRKIEYERASVIVSTPQTIHNDIEKKIFDPHGVSLVIFDECHRGIGKYAYTFVAEAVRENALIVGLTASPGGKRERIKEVLDSLFLTNVEIRTHTDPDVAPYVKKSDVRTIFVDLSPTLKKIKDALHRLISEYAQRMGGMGFPPPIKSKGLFMKMREKILGIQHAMKYPLLLNYFALMNLLHMEELLETQGVHSLREYLKKFDEKDGKSAAALKKRREFGEIVNMCETEEEHPKLRILVDLFKNELAGKKAIVFAQYRSQIGKIVDELKKNGIAARQFVGKKDGVTRKIQEETIAEFRTGAFLVLVASSIGEEGLDIPAVDSVVFYEPIPSEIRSIQRRGRAGRFKEGEIIILVTRGTRDEYYHWSSFNREKRMKHIITSMQGRKNMPIAEKQAKKESENAKPGTDRLAQNQTRPEMRGSKQKKPGQTSLSSFC